jgi:hypothetical protein
MIICLQSLWLQSLRTFCWFPGRLQVQTAQIDQTKRSKNNLLSGPVRSAKDHVLSGIHVHKFYLEMADRMRVYRKDVALRGRQDHDVTEVAISFCKPFT